MNLDEYQKRARTTAIYSVQHAVVYPALGLVGEAGELTNKLKKILRDGKPAEGARLELADELGDVLWYVAALATDLRFSLSAIAERNLAKLASRAERGTLGGSGDDR